MTSSAPHFLLFSDTRPARQGQAGRWHFLLESLSDGTRLEAADDEPEVSGERLELLALVRALEALDQPSRVTLVTTSSQVQRGLRDGLRTWRNNGWRWESYGRLVPIKHADLWQRIDRALEFHRIECRMVRVDGAHPALSPSVTADRRQQRVPRFWHPLSALRQAAHRLRLRLTRGLAGALRPWNARPFGPASA